MRYFSSFSAPAASLTRLWAMEMTSRPRLSSIVRAGVSACSAASCAARVFRSSDVGSGCRILRLRYQALPGFLSRVSFWSNVRTCQGENSTRLKLPSGISVRTVRRRHRNK